MLLQAHVHTLRAKQLLQSCTAQEQGSLVGHEGKRFFLQLDSGTVRVGSLQQEVAIANRCQPRGAKRVGVQVPPLLLRSRKVPKWHPPLELVGPYWPGLSDRYIWYQSLTGTARDAVMERQETSKHRN